MNREHQKKLLYGIWPVVLFGVITGLILWYRMFEYPPHRYSLDFSEALWISTGKQTPHGYFVKEMWVPVEVGDAWIKLAGTDSMDVYINGRKVSSDEFVSVNVSAVHDITGTIHRGKNVIGIYVKRSSYPGGPRLLVKGTYTDLSGNKHVFTTDETWMTSSLEEVQGHGDIPWYSQEFDHSRWGKTIVAGKDSTFPIYPSSIPPYIVGSPLSGYWIWHPEPGVRVASFSKSLILRSPVKDAIIGVSASSNFDVTVNGMPVVKGALCNKSINIYNVTSLFRSGENTIGVGVSALDGTPGLLVEGYIDDGNSVTRLESDETWEAESRITGPGDTPARNRSELRTPLLLAKYPAEPWGVLAKEIQDVEIPLSFEIKHFLKIGSFIGMCVGLVLCVWIGIAFLYAGIGNKDLGDALLLDSVFHIPPLLFMVFVYLLKFDVRFDPSFPFRYEVILVALTSIFLFRLFGLLPVAGKNWTPRSVGPEHRELSRLFALFLLVCLMSAGFLIRIHKLDYASLSHDEITMVRFTQGLLNKGFPFIEIGSMIKPLTTYEILPYSISVPVMLFGLNDFAVRLHSVFWGTLEILALYLLGKALFNRMTGLLAAAIYTFHPWCIIWSQNAYYPQLTQLLASLTVLFFYKAIDTTPLNKRFLYATGISFSLMYLSWEGSGFLLCAMALALLAYKGSDLSWLRNKHLWASFAIVFLTVFIQMSRRILYQHMYLAMGYSNAELGMPTLFFMDPMYSPYVYIKYFFGTENNYVCTALLVAGIFLAHRYRPLRYLYVMLLSTVFLMTNFLSVASTRYVYYMEPFLVLIACAVGLYYIDVLKNLCKDRRLVLRMSRTLSATVFSVVLFAASNSVFLKLYLLSKSPFDPPTLVRQNVYWYDYKSTGQYLRENARQGDLIIAMMPHALQYYAGVKGDYGLMTLPDKLEVYDIGGDYQGFMDKYVGNPSIGDLEEFKRIVGTSTRIWLVAAPDSALLDLNGATVVDYIREYFRSVYQGYGTRIYLWER